ncbi:MAG: sulfite exporter TauE/SafE family protein [Parvularculaceae bacterium]
MDLENLASHAPLIAGVLAAGLAAGFASGLFGIGGGVVTVPALYAAFRSIGVADDASLKSAIGTSLAVIIVSSIRSLITHRRSGHVDGRILRAWAPWIAIGSVAGGLLARHVPAIALTLVFAAGAGFIGWRRLRPKHKAALEHPRDLTDQRIHIPIGLATGFFSALMGLGGGAVGVMIMTWSGRSMHQAIATASGFGIAVAVPGSVAFIVSGLGHNGLPPFSLGFVNVPAFIAMAAMTAVTAHAGAVLAHKLNGDFLSKLFGAYILLSALALVADAIAG